MRARAATALLLGCALCLGILHAGLVRKSPGQGVQLADLVLVPQVGNASRVKAMTVSPDGKIALTLSEEVKLWDLQTRKEVRSFRQASGMAALVLLPDGKSMVVSPTVWGGANRQNPGDTALRQYELATGNVLREFRGHTWASASLAVSGDGSRLVSSVDKSACLWDLRDGKLLATWPLEPASRALAMNRDGSVVAFSRFKDAMVELWDVAAGRPRARLGETNQGEALPEPEKLGMSDDGRWVFGHVKPFNRDLRVFENRVYVWDASTGTLRTRLDLGAPSLSRQTFVDYDATTKRFFLLREGGRRLEFYDPVADRVLTNVASALRHDETSRNRVTAAALLPSGPGVLLAISEGDSLWGHVLKTVDFQAPELVSAVHPSLDIYSSIAVDPSNRYFLAWGGGSEGAALWNMETGRLEDREALPRGMSPVCHVLSGDGKSIFIGANASLWKWDVGGRRISTNWKLGWTPLKLVAAGEALLSYAYLKSEYGGGGEYAVFRLDGRTGAVLARSARGYYSGDGIALSPDGATVAFAAGFRMPIFDAKTLALVREIEIGSYAFDPVFLSDNATVAHPNGRALRFIHTGTGTRSQSTFEIAGSITISQRSAHFREIRRPDASDPSRMTVHFRRLSDGQEVERGSLSPEDPIARPYLYAAAGRKGVQRRNLWSGNEVTCLSESKGGQWVVYDHRGYWDGSPNAGDLVAMVRRSGGVDSFQIDQFAMRNNRPDRILESLDSTNETLMRHFQQLHQKRLRRMGVEEAGLEAELRVPGAELRGRAQDAFGVQLGLRFTAGDAPLARYQVFVNHVPIFGAEGASLERMDRADRQADGRTVSFLQDVPLGIGLNKVEFSCTDRQGIESFRRPLFAYRSAPPGMAKPNLYFLGLGVSDYADPAIRDLHYAEKDVVDLEKAFRALEGRRFGKVFVKTLLGREVTRASIAQAAAFPGDASVDDLFVLFISGHGIQAGKGPTYYYVTADALLSDLESTSAPFQMVEGLLHGIRPRQKLFLMDTCESGEADEVSSNAGAAGMASKGLYARTLGFERARALRVVPRSVSRADAERDRFIHSDLLRRSGAIVISSSRGDEASLESDELRQGLFTHAVLTALRERGRSDADRDGVVSVRELRRFVESEVPRLAESLFPGAGQHPVVDRDNLFLDFGF